MSDEQNNEKKEVPVNEEKSPEQIAKEEMMKKRLEELRKRDPFIYR